MGIDSTILKGIGNDIAVTIFNLLDLYEIGEKFKLISNIARSANVTLTDEKKSHVGGELLVCTYENNSILLLKSNQIRPGQTK